MFDFAKQNLAEYESAPDDRRLANALVMLNHVPDWVWRHWVNGNEVRKAALGVGAHWACQQKPEPEKDFQEWVEKRCGEAKLVRDIVNGVKHARDTGPTTSQGMIMDGVNFLFPNHSEGHTVYIQEGEDVMITNLVSSGPAGSVVNNLIEFWEKFFSITAKDW
ncbi:MAG: hypothetical protein QM723_01300 [Myxococcaceae bacterium]